MKSGDANGYNCNKHKYSETLPAPLLRVIVSGSEEPSATTRRPRTSGCLREEVHLEISRIEANKHMSASMAGFAAANTRRVRER